MADFIEIPVRFMRIPAVSRLGEEGHGCDSIVVLLALMFDAGRRGKTGTFEAYICDLAASAFVDELTAVQSINKAREIGLVLELEYDDPVVRGRVSPQILRTRSRRRIPRRVREFVLRRDGGTCQLCGEPISPGDEVHLDHVIPWSHGGADTADNLQVAHGFCNRSKRARLPEGG